TVTSGAGAVNEGTVTFTLMQGSTAIGTATTSGTVSNGAASVSYVLPAGTVAGPYTIDAVYNPGADFTGSSDTTHTLTVNPASTTTAASSAAATFSDSTQNVTLSATLTSGAGPVNEGTVMFTVLQGATVIGTPATSLPVSNGQASVNYALPGGLAAGSYTLEADYGDSAGNFLVGSGQASLTINAATPTVSVTDAGGTYNGSPFPATATVAGVDNTPAAQLEGVTPTLTYYAGSYTLGKLPRGGSAAAPTATGRYTELASVPRSA